MKKTYKIIASTFVVMSFVAVIVDSAMAVPAALAAVTYAILSAND